MRAPSIPVQVAVHAGLVLFTSATLYPILWVVRMSLTPGQGFQTNLSPIPTAVSAEHYVGVINTIAADGSWLFGRQLLNSLVVSSATAFVGCAMATSAAYALSRFRFPGREGGMDAFLVTQMFPGVVLAVPLYVILDRLGLLDALSGLVLVYATTSVPFATFTLKGFFDTLPRELEEAALLDGASRLQTFVRIILPLARPALAVTFLFSFMTAWNEFVLANTLLSDPRAWTLPLVLQRYVDDYGTQWGHFAAGSILVSAPVVILFFALQRHFVEGLTAGAVKG